MAAVDELESKLSFVSFAAEHFFTFPKVLLFPGWIESGICKDFSQKSLKRPISMGKPSGDVEDMTDLSHAWDLWWADQDAVVVGRVGLDFWDLPRSRSVFP